MSTYIVPYMLPIKVQVSRNDVRRELVLDESDPVAQDELALLEPLDLQEVRARRNLKRLDRRIEVAMLLEEPRQLGAELAFFLFCHAPQWLRGTPAPSPRAETRTSIAR